jgi:MarR family 2-MHQ and catechol resistance regulon transcriptional repressor
MGRGGMATQYEGTEAEKRALDTYIKLSRAAETVLSRVHQHLAGVRLTPSQFSVLEMLHHLGPLHQNELAGKMLKSNANLTFVIDNLVKRDLVCRERDDADRRYMLVRLTDAGAQLIQDIFPRHVDIIMEEFSILTVEEQDTLARLCRKIGLRAED